MLRVRPRVITADLRRAATFLQALGLRPAEHPRGSCTDAVFDAGSGRVTVHGCGAGEPEEGTTLAFDVADVREFARRTMEAGTPVELTEDASPEARVTAPDGVTFRASSGPRETGSAPHGAGSASPSLSVLALWSTPDIPSAVRVLTDIGAKPGISPDAGTWHEFRAKNGGLVALHAAERAAIDLGFEYGGDVRNLVGALTPAGFESVVVDGIWGRSLRVLAPWGAEVWIRERQRDLQGYTGH